MQALVHGAQLRRRATVLRVPLLGRRRRSRRDRDLPPRRDGLDPRQDRPPTPAERRHRLRVALAPATPGAPPRALPRAVRLVLSDGFGMTETNAVIGARDGKQRPGTMGYVMPGYDAKIVDENDDEVPDGTPGELVMRADEPFAFATGYWRMPEQTVEAGATSGSTPATAPSATRRQLPLPRPDEGRDPAARREHLRVGGRAGPRGAPRRRRRRRDPSPLRARRGRGDGGRRHRRATAPSSPKP